jgi:hypothetical protein
LATSELNVLRVRAVLAGYSVVEIVNRAPLATTYRLYDGTPRRLPALSYSSFEDAYRYFLDP